MQFSTVVATIAAAAAVVSAGAIPQADRQTMEVYKRQNVYTDGSMTWYAGASLDAPACGGPTPSDDSFIVAVPASSPAKCGDVVHLHYNGNMVPARVVDQCEGCAPHQVDATKAVFSSLADLDIGQLEGVHLVVFSP